MSSIFYNPFKSAPPTIPLAALRVDKRGEALSERASGSRLGGRGWGLVAPAQRPKVSKTYASTVGLPGLNLAPRYAISKTKVWKAGPFRDQRVKRGYPIELTNRVSKRAPLLPSDANPKQSGL